jgi:hypothetical protein
MDGVTAAAKRPARPRLTISHENDGAKLVRTFAPVNPNNPMTMTVRFPILSAVAPNPGAAAAYRREKDATIRPALDGEMAYRCAMAGSRGETTNKSVPIVKRVTHPTANLKRWLHSVFTCFTASIVDIYYL